MAHLSRSYQGQFPGTPANTQDSSRQRSVERIVSKLPAWITLHSHDASDHVAFVRDISPRGIFFYSDFRPHQGDEIVFVMQYLNWSKAPRLHCKGRVVRLEKAVQGSAFGIAVSFETA
jgi:PilZ domain